MPREQGPSAAGRRILLVGNWPPPLGGVSVHVQRLRSVLQARGLFVAVLEPTLHGDARASHQDNREPGVWRADSGAGFAARLTALSARSDLIHLHTSGANPRSWFLVHAVGRTAQTLSRPCLVTFHSGHLPAYVNSPARAVSARIALAPYRQIITVSEALDLHLRRIGAPGERMRVLPAFGLDGHAAADPDEPFRSNHSLFGKVVANARQIRSRRRGIEEHYRRSRRLDSIDDGQMLDDIDRIERDSTGRTRHRLLQDGCLSAGIG